MRPGRVFADSDPHKAIKMRLACRVEEPPAPVEVGFKDSVEIRRHEAKGVATDEAGRNSEAPAECNSEVRKIAADARAFEKRLVGSRFFIAGSVLILQMIVNPAADRIDALTGRAAMTRIRPARMTRGGLMEHTALEAGTAG
jgi:hypothetical protein